MASPELLTRASPAEYDPGRYWTETHLLHSGSLAAVGYPALGDGFNRVTYALRRRAVVRMFDRQLIVPPASILEAAVGVGAYAAVWQELKVARWIGLDISEEAVGHCRRLYPEGEFVRQDLAASAWPSPLNDEFDLVSAIDVLYHLVDDGAFLAALENLSVRVRSGGGLLISDVFVARDRRIAPHVKRRSLDTYQTALGPRFRLVGREPVFALLGDPLPRSASDVCSQALLVGWQLLAKVTRSVPSGVRDTFGTTAVVLAWPADALFRRLGLAQGVNLELALFART